MGTNEISYVVLAGIYSKSKSSNIYIFNSAKYITQIWNDTEDQKHVVLTEPW
uniref:Uncharacterized protein n=1 Tax=Arundo donax TaxID=35708 RepID=A0A0A9BZQ7_ARUDO